MSLKLLCNSVQNSSTHFVQLLQELYKIVYSGSQYGAWLMSNTQYLYYRCFSLCFPSHSSRSWSSWSGRTRSGGLVSFLGAGLDQVGPSRPPELGYLFQPEPQCLTFPKFQKLIGPIRISQDQPHPTKFRKCQQISQPNKLQQQLKIKH